MWNDTSSLRPKTPCPDYRHVEAFRRVYVERDLSKAADTMFSSKRSVSRLLKDMDKQCGETLFVPQPDGGLLPTPFGERLFTDTGNLEKAMDALMAKITEIREIGRVLRVSTTPAIFRSAGFREIFRDLQATEGFRIAFIPSRDADPGKALAQGKCDLFLTFGGTCGERFARPEIATIPMRAYARGTAGGEGTSGKFHTLGSVAPELPDTVAIADEDWLRWLDNPMECPLGTRMFVPEISPDPLFWTEVSAPADWQPSLTLHALYLQQHPYEFLPRLCSGLRNHFLK